MLSKGKTIVAVGMLITTVSAGAYFLGHNPKGQGIIVGIATICIGVVIVLGENLDEKPKKEQK